MLISQTSKDKVSPNVLNYSTDRYFFIKKYRYRESTDFFRVAVRIRIKQVRFRHKNFANADPNFSLDLGQAIRIRICNTAFWKFIVKKFVCNRVKQKIVNSIVLDQNIFNADLDPDPWF